MSLRDVGWVWEGQPAYRDFPPSMYGFGEGCEYFDLSKAYCLYHGNNERMLSKLQDLDEIVCDLSIWKYRKIENAEKHIGWGIYHEMDPDIMLEEARKISALSTKLPNIVGAMKDDLLGAVKSKTYKPGLFAEVRRALTSENPDLKLFSVVYVRELAPDNWKDIADALDGIYLWVWESRNLEPTLDEGIDRCREIFPDKPIVLGCYLRDYTLQTPMPMDRLQWQWERIPGYLEQGKITGYCILGAYLIDHHRENAEWVRDFIAAH